MLRVVCSVACNVVLREVRAFLCCVQCVVQSGETPTVLQQLCSLPWQYFSEPGLTELLFPTLLACSTGSDHNTALLHTEMSAQVSCGILSIA